MDVDVLMPSQPIHIDVHISIRSQPIHIYRYAHINASQPIHIHRYLVESADGRQHGRTRVGDHILFAIRAGESRGGGD